MPNLMKKVLYIASICCIFIAVITTNAFAAKEEKISLLKSNQSFRPNFSSQPNLDNGEVTMPVQVSIIYIVEQSLPDFLTQLASRNSIQLSLSDKVSGVLKKISLPMQLELLLPEISRSYGLEWHMQGKHLFVSSSLENTNRLITLGDMSMLQLQEALKKAGLNPGANRMSFAEEKNAVTLIGSSKYILKVEAIVREHQSMVKSN